MHVLQHIATTAESAEEAFRNVESTFNEMYSESEGLGGWSDWYVVGGGRWNSDSSNQYKDSWNDVVAFDNAPDQYRSIVQTALETRSEEMGRIRKELNTDEFIRLVDEFISDPDVASNRFDMTHYYFRTAANLMSGFWNQDSYFYDIENHTTTPQYMLNSIDNGAKNWYLVPVDFHF